MIISRAHFRADYVTLVAQDTGGAKCLYKLIVKVYDKYFDTDFRFNG
jgi:hypothetical protein